MQGEPALDLAALINYDCNLGCVRQSGYVRARAEYHSQGRQLHCAVYRRATRDSGSIFIRAITFEEACAEYSGAIQSKTVSMKFEV